MNAKKPKGLGPLHELIKRGLPDWIDSNGFLRVYDLASYLGISYQALYKIFERNRIPPKRAKALIHLSKDNPQPLTYEDFTEFM